jgi:predicted DCC family thiol-disulfide oxidoreductase YuxK
MSEAVSSGNSVVLFDGVCNLCNKWVQFVINRDPERHFRFASLQSAQGRALLQAHGLPVDHLGSIVLIQSNRAFQESDAVLRIARGLRAPWPMAGIFMVLPRALRDFVYRIIARNRYRWFGQADSCMLLFPNSAERFLS